MTKINCLRTLILTCTILIATCVIKLNAQCAETFEAVTPPALPAGWSATTLLDCGSSNPWVTSSTTPITGTRSAFVNAPACTSDEALYSRFFAITSATSQLSFSRKHDFEAGYDGMVLEISIGGNTFQDILAAGGSFVSGGYTGTINSSENPLSLRQAWLGNTATIGSVVNLPASANGQLVRFRWRRGTDISVGGNGAYIDNISITGCNTTNACAENFNSVTAPALPSGWSASTTTDCATSNPWATVSSVFDSAPNSAFVNDPDCVSDEFLYSKPYQITSSTAQITFRRNNNLENGYDGFVLEVSVDGAMFTDIISAGGVFVVGGYTGLISNCCQNPLSDRNAWTGTTGGTWVTTTINLPATANGKIVIFRWRRGTDDSVPGTGAYIDGVSVTGSLCGAGCGGNIILSQSSTFICNGPVLLTASGGSGTYQWFKNNNIIIGETGSTYSAPTFGIYYAKSTVSGCVVTSNVVVVDEGAVTPIATGTGVHCLGNFVEIIVPATENNQEYIWRKDGNIVYTIPTGSGGGPQSYSFTMDATKAGIYKVESSIPGCQTVYSNEVYIGAPVITGLQAISVCNAEVKVKWNRVIPEFITQSYQYDLSLSITPGTPDGTTSDSSLILAVNPSLNYYLHVRSACGVSSFGAWTTLSFTTPGSVGSLSITPLSGNLCMGPIVLTATGGGPVYAWYQDNVLIPGATGSSYSATTAGAYKAITFIGACEVISNIVTLESSPVVPPNADGDGTYCTGSLAEVRILDTEVTQDYTWKLNGVVQRYIPIGGGGGNQSLNVAVNAATEGLYIIETSKPGCPAETTTVDVERCLITGLTVTTTCPTQVSFNWNSLMSGNYEYEVTQTSTPPAFTTNPQTSATNATVTGLTPSTLYYIHVQGAAGDGSSFCNSWTTISFTTSAGSAISLSPLTGNTCGTTLQLTATGAGPVYEWYKNGVLIPGITGATFNAFEGGAYQVKCIVGACTISSNLANIEASPVIYPNSDGDGTYCNGSNADVRILGTVTTQDYTWKLNGTVQRYIPIGGGGGNQSLNVAVTAATQGTYVIETSKPGCPVETDYVEVDLPIITGLMVTNTCPTEVSFEWSYLTSSTYQYQVSTSSTPPAIPSNPPTSATNVTVSGLTPSTVYYIHVRAASSSGSFCGSWVTITFTTPAIPASPVTAIWTGTINTSWTNPGNWQCGLVPGTTSEVIVDGNLPNYPVITTNKTIRKLTANPNATVTINPGVVLTITGN